MTFVRSLSKRRGHDSLLQSASVWEVSLNCPCPAPKKQSPAQPGSRPIGERLLQHRPPTVLLVGGGDFLQQGVNLTFRADLHSGAIVKESPIILLRITVPN